MEELRWDSKYTEELLALRKKTYAGGGEKRIQKQHEAGKLTARERLELLFDGGSFQEVNLFSESRCVDFSMTDKKVPGDGVIVGYGKINNRLVFASSEDFTVIGGTLGEYHSMKICHIMDMAIRMKAPFISINDSGGARIEEGIDSLSGYASIFLKNTQASGLIPQISIILGPCAGGACYSPAITDFIIMSEKTAKMFITGPGVIKTVTGESVTPEQLGGAQVHASQSGVVHFVEADDIACIERAKRILTYLPQNNTEDSPHEGIGADPELDLELIVPDAQKKSYNIKQVVEGIVDRDSFMEVQSQFARNAVIGFARLNSETVGIVANQPSQLSGAIDINASDKMARFVRFCDCFNIPILTLVDVTGFLPGKNQEHSGIIRHGAKLLYAYSEATVPKISLILRKAYGGAYIAMNSKNMGADIVFAWPIAQVAVMGSEGAVDIIYRKEILEASDPTAKREELKIQYESHYMNPYKIAARGYVDEIILPSETRDRICNAFLMLKTKETLRINKKHGNIPL